MEPTTQSSVQPSQTSAPARMQPRKKVALWLLIAPTSLLIVTFALFAFVNFFSTLLAPITADTEIMTQPVALTITNVVLFLFGAIASIAWLPGLIAGIILLATEEK